MNATTASPQSSRSRVWLAAAVAVALAVALLPATSSSATQVGWTGNERVEVISAGANFIRVAWEIAQGDVERYALVAAPADPFDPADVAVYATLSAAPGARVQTATLSAPPNPQEPSAVLDISDTEFLIGVVALGEGETVDLYQQYDAVGGTSPGELLFALDDPRFSVSTLVDTNDTYWDGEPSKFLVNLQVGDPEVDSIPITWEFASPMAAPGTTRYDEFIVYVDGVEHGRTSTPYQEDEFHWFEYDVDGLNPSSGYTIRVDVTTNPVLNLEDEFYTGPTVWSVTYPEPMSWNATTYQQVGGNGSFAEISFPEPVGVGVAPAQVIGYWVTVDGADQFFVPVEPDGSHMPLSIGNLPSGQPSDVDVTAIDTIGRPVPGGLSGQVVTDGWVPGASATFELVNPISIAQGAVVEWSPFIGADEYRIDINGTDYTVPAGPSEPTSLEFPTLAPLSNYTATVYATVDGVESEGPSAELWTGAGFTSIVEPPASGLPMWDGQTMVATQVRHASLRLGWQNANAPVDDYVVIMRPGGSTGDWTVIEVEPTGIEGTQPPTGVIEHDFRYGYTSAIVSGLNPETHYEFAVVGLEEGHGLDVGSTWNDGSSPNFGPDLSVTTEPEPDGFGSGFQIGSILNETATSFTARWRTPGSGIWPDITGFQVYVDGVPYQTLPGTADQVNIAGLQPNTLYTVRVVATRGANDPYDASIQVATLPEAMTWPEGQQPIQVGAAEDSVTVQIPEPVGTSFNRTALYFASIDPAALMTDASWISATPTVTVGALQDSTDYTVHVIAMDIFGRPISGGPLTVEVSTTGWGSEGLTFDVAEDPADGATIGWPEFPSADAYEITVSGGIGPFTVPAGQPREQHTGPLAPNTRYDVTVDATTGGSTAEGPTGYFWTPPVVPAGNPQLELTGVTTTTASFEWPAMADVNYLLELDGPGGDTFTPSGSTTTATGLTPGTAYEATLTYLGQGGQASLPTITIYTLTTAPDEPVTDPLGVAGFSVADFAPIDWPLQPTTTTATFDPFYVGDNRGTGAGWSMTVSATPLDNGDGHVLDVGTLRMNFGGLTVDPYGDNTFAPPVAATTGTVDVDDGPVALLTADPEVGMGTWMVGLPDLQATLDSRVRAGTYTSTVTIDLVAGP